MHSVRRIKAARGAEFSTGDTDARARGFLYENFISIRKQLRFLPTRSINSYLPLAESSLYAASDAFSFRRFIHYVLVVVAVVDKTYGDLFRLFRSLETMCERDRIARFSCTTLEILSVPAN